MYVICSTVVSIIIKSKTFMKDVFDLSTMTKALHTKNLGSVSIHHTNIPELYFGMVKVKNDKAAEVVQYIFFGIK